jgi:hypothetical protein
MMEERWKFYYQLVAYIIGDRILVLDGINKSNAFSYEDGLSENELNAEARSIL